MSDDQRQSEPGWFPNPEDPSQRRFWDGQDLTDTRGVAAEDGHSEVRDAGLSAEQSSPIDSGALSEHHTVRHVCRKCSAETETDSTIHACPECGTPFIKPPVWKNRLVQVGAGAAVLALVATGAVVALQSNAENQREKEAAAAAAAEAQRQKEAEEAAAQEAADQAAQEQAAAELQVQLRQATVKDIQRAVTKMARDHASQGMLDGWPKRTECTPKSGQSIENLNRSSTSFACFVVTDDNSDGTYSGYNYHALMNWDTGQYTYGFGK